jgi:hypothetical protein
MALNRRVHPSGNTLQVALDTWDLLHPGTIQTSGSDQHRRAMVKNIMNTCLYIQMISWRLVDPKDILMKLNKYFKLKPDSIHLPDDYLGTKIKKTVLPNGASAWGQSSSHYVRIAVKKLEEWMVKEGRKLPKKAPTPMSSMYKLEVDVSPELSLEMANFYQS